MENMIAMEDAIYFTCGEEDGYSYLWKCNKKNGTLSEPEIFDEDIWTFYYRDINGKLGYYKNKDESKADFYLDGELVDYDVDAYGFGNEITEDDNFYYYSYAGEDYNDLFYYEKGEKELLVEEVKRLVQLSSSQALILDSGDTLYCFDANAKEQVKQIATGVDAIFLADNIEN